jgi:hypothetical protein
MVRGHRKVPELERLLVVDTVIDAKGIEDMWRGNDLIAHEPVVATVEERPTDAVQMRAQRGAVGLPPGGRAGVIPV